MDVSEISRLRKEWLTLKRTRTTLERKLAKTKARLIDLEAHIFVLDPQMVLFARPISRNPIFDRGELASLTFGALREARGPLGAYQVARDILAAKGYQEPSPVLMRFVRSRVTARFNLLKRKGVVEKVGAGWVLK